MIDFSQLFFMMSDQGISIDTIGLNIEDIDLKKERVDGLNQIKEIVKDFKRISKPIAPTEETYRLPICTECSALTHLTENCPHLAAKEDTKDEDDKSDDSIIDMFTKKIPKKKKYQKEAPINLDKIKKPKKKKNQM